MTAASDTWADQLIFPPWIEDGDGCLFNQAFQLSKFAGHRRPDGDGFAPSPSLHSQTDSREGQHDHA